MSVRDLLEHLSMARYTLWLHKRMRATPIVDDDFPDVLYEADRALDRYEKSYGSLPHTAAPHTSSIPRIVCLCGSTRFKEAFLRAQFEETMAGRIVLSVGAFGHADGLELTVAQKEMLDSLHKKKIDLADEILVINVDGYIGDSTRGEIDHALEHGVVVRYLEEQD